MLEAQLRTLCQAIMVIFAMGMSPALASPTCPIDYGAYAGDKPNKLYLLLPPKKVDDESLFPAHGFNPTTKWLPLQFNTSDLRHYTGSFDQLKDAIRDVVAEIF